MPTKQPMSPQTGLVTIVTPCYNAAPFIAETITSVRAQTYPWIEHIVVDDGSRDESWSVISSFAEHTTTLRLERNYGGSYARNRGAELAQGEFLMFLDADDVLAPGAIAALVDALQNHSFTIAACQWKRLKPAADDSWILTPADVPRPHGDILAGWLSGQFWVPPCAVLWTRDAYDLAGPWDENISANDDGDLMMRAFLTGIRLTFSAGGEAHYRWHGYSRVSLGRASFSEAWFRSHLRVLEKITRVLESRGNLAPYARPLGIAYHKLALLAFQHGEAPLGRECTDLGKSFAGPMDFSRTRLGRFVTRVVGLERKEQLAGWLAKRGVVSAYRQRGRTLRARYLRDKGLRQVEATSFPGTSGIDTRTQRVTIAVVTYRRPLGLVRLLHGLRGLQFSKVAPPACRILVIDNDPEGSAAAICQEERDCLPWPLAYVVEPSRGISQARNAAVRHGIADADWLAFIDDDEVPQTCWLDELLHVQQTYGAHVVAGPVVPVFQEPPARWIINGNFFALPRYATGASLDRAYTGNVLVSTQVFHGMPEAFDERLGLSGGEDVHFFRRAAARGYRLVWADEAIAEEYIPPSRATASWLVRRAYRTGSIWGVCDRDLEASSVTIAHHTARSIARIVKGVLVGPPSFLLGRHLAIKAARTAALGVGYLAGLARLRYEEYRTTDAVSVGSRFATPEALKSREASSTAVGGHEHSIKVLAWPAWHAKNPYIPLLYDNMRKLGADIEAFSPQAILRTRADVWHVHWPDSLLNGPSLPRAIARVGAMVVLLRLAKSRGLRIVWTVHNLATHEAYHPRLEHWFWRVFTAALDGFIALTPGGKAAAEMRYPALRQARSFVVPHGHYRDVYPNTVSRSEARAALGISLEARVIACVGHVRAYKNILHLIEVFREFSDPDARLLIAGEPTPASLGDAVVGAARADSRVLTLLGFVPSGDVQLFLRAADLVVLPYQELLNSGSAILALSFGCPVLVALQGAMGELAQVAGSEWVRTYSGNLTAATLAEGLEWALRTPRSKCCRGIAALSWPDVARSTLEAFSAVRADGYLREPTYSKEGELGERRGDRAEPPGRFSGPHSKRA